MQTNQRSSTPTVPGAALVAALVLAALSAGTACASPRIRSAPMHAESGRSVGDKREPDCWYSEGNIRLRGKRFALFTGATVTQFTNAASRAAYGWGSVSPVIELYRPQHRGLSPIFELNGVRIAQHGEYARVFSASAGVRYRPVDAARSRWIVPVVSAAVGPRFARTSTAGSTTLFGASAQAGIELMRTVRVSTHYETLPRVFGEHLNTISFSAAFHIPFPTRRASVASNVAPNDGRVTCAVSQGAK